MFLLKLYELVDGFLHKTYQIVKEEKEKQIQNEDLTHISYGQFNVLYWIFTLKKPSIKMLAEAMEVSKSTMTVHIQNLEKMGLVYKETSEKDRRFQVVRISEKGKRIEAGEKNAYKKIANILEEELSSEEIKVLSKALERVTMLDNNIKND